MNTSTEIKMKFPLTASQKVLRVAELFSVELANTRENNVLTMYMLFKPEEKNENIEKAFNKMLETSDSLRLLMEKKGLGFVQFVDDYVWKKLDVETLDGGYEAFEEVVKNRSAYEIRWESKPLYIAKLFVYNGGKAFFFRAHHAVIDGYSMGLLMQRFESYYEAYAAGQEPNVGKVGSIIQVFEKEAEYLKSDVYKEDKKYWAKAFLSQPNLRLPAGRRSPRGSCDNIDLSIENDRLDKLMQFCRECGCSSNIVGLALSALTVYSLSGKSNFAFYVLSHNRDTFLLKKTAGCLMSNVPVFFRLRNEQTVTDFISDVYMTYLESLQHRNCPMTDLLLPSYPSAVMNGFNFNHGWLLYSVMNLSAVVDALHHPCVMPAPANIPHQFYLAFLEIPGQSIGIDLRYQNHRFNEKQIKRYCDRYLQIMDQVIGEKALTVGQVYADSQK